MIALLAGIPIASAITGYTWYRHARHQRIKELYARAIAWDQPEGAHVRPIDRPVERKCSCSPYAWNPLLAREMCSQHGYLAEKLADEVSLRGYAMTGVPTMHQHLEYWCEHCPQYGECLVCGQNHEREGA